MKPICYDMPEIAIGSCHHHHPACQMLILRNFNQLPIFDTSSFINKISLFRIWATESIRNGNYVAERAAEVVPSFHPWFLYLPNWRMILMLKWRLWVPKVWQFPCSLGKFSCLFEISFCKVLTSIVSVGTLNEVRFVGIDISIAISFGWPVEKKQFTAKYIIWPKKIKTASLERMYTFVY